MYKLLIQIKNSQTKSSACSAECVQSEGMQAGTRL